MRHVVFSLALLFGSCLTAASSAATTPYANQIQELRQIKHLLEHADHDYQGHRAAAVHDITKAIHALEPYHRPMQHSTAVHSGKPHELQALSDTQLRGAIDGLNKVNQGLLLAATKHKHAQVASVHVQQAVKQLQIALTIK